MTCQEFRQRTTIAPEDMTRAERLVMYGHMMGCPACSQYVRENRNDPVGGHRAASPAETKALVDIDMSDPEARDTVGKEKYDLWIAGHSRSMASEGSSQQPKAG